MTRFADTGRLLRTISHLRPAQVLHRGRLTARRILWERLGRTIDARYWRAAAAFAPARWNAPGLARLTELRLGRTPIEDRFRIADDALVGRFTFLGRAEELGRDVAWQRADLDRGTRLWKTMLHELSCVEHLAVCARESGRDDYRRRLWDLLASWRAQNPIGCRDFARDSWNARAVATRMLHLAVAAHVMQPLSNDPDAQELGRDLARHAAFLRDNLEWDLGCNHLIRDLLGLVAASALFPGFDASLPLLRDQLAAQVLADGCHIERAPLYHAVVLQDLVEARTLLGDGSPGWLGDAIGRMAGHLRAVVHGDGELPLFGDSWHGEIDIARLLAEAGANRSSHTLDAPGERGGLVALQHGESKLVMRAGPHGPDHQLGHAHADLLSFELSHGRHRLVSDTGTGTYDQGPIRERSRSTAAHNTLQIDGVEQLEAWSSFRVGRRGRAEIVAHASSDDTSWIWARHDAYRHLRGGPIHHRLVVLGSDALLVIDAVLGSGRHRVASRLHVHPDAPVELVRIEPLDGVVSESTVPLYERFNLHREMRELTTEHAEVALPWLGGWLLLTGPASRAAGKLTWEARDGAALVQYQSSRLRLDAGWHPEREGRPDAVHVRLG